MNRAFVISEIGEPGSPERVRADDVLDLIVKPVVSEDEFGLEPLRSDQDPTPGHVTSGLIKSILESRVVIAEMTGHNPNVYYELGVVHSFQLPVVLLVDNTSSLSFDAQHERVIVIGDNGVISARQAHQAKEQLRISLRVVLADGYRASSLVASVAGRQSLAKLAPDDPVAAELSNITQTLDALGRAVADLSQSSRQFQFAPALVSASAFDTGTAPPGFTVSAQPGSVIGGRPGTSRVVHSSVDLYRTGSVVNFDSEGRRVQPAEPEGSAERANPKSAVQPADGGEPKPEG